MGTGMPGVIVVRDVATTKELEQCFAIRLEVFVGEQKVPEAEELDSFDTDESTVHIIALNGSEAIGTCRILPEGPGRCHIGRVALCVASRGTGAGKAMMAYAARRALELCGDDAGVSRSQEACADMGQGSNERRRVRIELSAQERVVPFYEACGYSLVAGERYLDAGIWHRDMVLELTE